MSYKGERTFVTGIYKCKDPIKNFKIRVKIKQDKSSLIPLPQFHSDTNNILEEGSNMKETEFEETTICWQEKIFSPFELSYYQYPGNCHTPLDQKYHNDVVELLKNGSACNRLFTYTDADNFSAENNGSLLNNAHNYTDTTTINHRVTNMHQRQRLVSCKTSRRERNASSQCIVDYTPSDEIRKNNHFLQCSIQTLYILADLSSMESDLKKQEDWIGHSEYVLCTMKYDTAANILTVTPDFNAITVDANAVPYCIEVNGDSRNTFQYWLEHVSASFILEEEDDEMEVLQKLLDRQLDIRQMKVGTEFSSPKTNVFLVHLLGEIVGAEEFEYEDVFVHFFFELPKGWTCEDGQLSGVTQRCSTRRTGMAYFCHLFESHLSLNLDALDETSDVVPCWPQFFAEVLSLDSWGRHRVEGYGHMKIPPTTGIHSVTLSMWRPLGNGPASDLQRFFVGGSPGLEDISSVGIPTSFEGDRLSKFGLRVVTSGKLHLRIHVMHQSKITYSDLFDAPDAKNRKRTQFLLERLSASTLVNSVNSVMAAFKRARDRMLQAKEGINI